MGGTRGRKGNDDDDDDDGGGGGGEDADGSKSNDDGGDNDEMQQQKQKQQDITVEEEEVWPTIQSLQVRHEIHTIPLGRLYGFDDDDHYDHHGDTHASNGSIDKTKILLSSSTTTTTSRCLHLWTLAEHQLTPLDMTYNDANDDENTNEKDENDDGHDHNGTSREYNYYDGTGGMLWLAARCWCEMVAMEIPAIMKYVSSSPPLPSTSLSTSSFNKNNNSNNSSSRKYHRVCELGCGTGAAGIALLKFSTDDRGRTRNNINSNNDNKHDDQQSTYRRRPYHVVFTDSDAKSLDWCHKNCEINHIDPNTYSQEVLLWGQDISMTTTTATASNDDDKDTHTNGVNVINRHSFDTVIATDVIYDLSMIRPLLQTAEQLLVLPEQQHQYESEENQTNQTSHEEHDNNNETNDEHSNQNGNYVILTHVPRFCLPRRYDDDDENEDQSKTTTTSNVEVDSKGRIDNDNNNSSNNNNNTNYLELEQHVIKEASFVGLQLKDLLRIDEVLNDYWLSQLQHPPSSLFSSSSPQTPTTVGVVDRSTTKDCGHHHNDKTSSFQSFSFEKVREAHAVVLVFERALR